jgi:hypothetical protein
MSEPVDYQAILAAVEADFRDLRLPSPVINRRTDAMMILDRDESGDPLVIVTRHFLQTSEDPARGLVEIARIVAPKGLN